MSMLKITAHAIVRYTERIKGIKVVGHDFHNIDKRKVELYKREITKMFKFSKIIHVGKFKEYKKSCYRLVDDIMLITNSSDNTIITLYRVDFGLLSRKENKRVKEDILYKLESERKELRKMRGMLKVKNSNVFDQYEKHKNNYDKLAKAICYSVALRKKNKKCKYCLIFKSEQNQFYCNMKKSISLRITGK